MGMFPRPKSVRLLLVVIVILGLSGCASSDPKDRLENLSAQEVLIRAINATAKVDTLRIRTTADGDDRSLVYDLRRTPDGTCFGEITNFKGSVSVIFSGNDTYVRGDARYWAQFDDPGFGRRMAREPSMWGRVQTADFYDQFCEVEELARFSGLDSERANDTATTQRRTDADGRDVVEVTHEGRRWTATVSADAPHYLLQIDAGPQRTVLTEFEEPMSLTIPGEGEYIAFDRLIVVL